MNFKQWYLNEVGTGTNCVAVFARPIFGNDLVKRKWPNFWGKEEENKDDFFVKREEKASHK